MTRLEESKNNLELTQAAIELWRELDHPETRALIEVLAKKDWGEATIAIFSSDGSEVTIENFDGRHRVFVRLVAKGKVA